MVIRVFILFFLLICEGCSNEFSVENYEVGSKGEPPKAHKRVFKKQFLAEEKNYVQAFGHIHRFLVGNQFLVKYTACFDDVLDVRKRSRKDFSCIALQAEKGLPTKAYFRIIVDEVLFNQLDNDNRLFYSAEMYVIEKYVRDGTAEQLIQAFTTDTEVMLSQLYVNESDDHHSRK